MWGRGEDGQLGHGGKLSMGAPVMIGAFMLHSQRHVTGKMTPIHFRW